MKVALVCDWLTNVGGAEKVLLELHKIYKDAPIYTSQYNPRKIDWFNDADVRTGWLQMFPAGMRKFLGPLRQRYFSKLDLSDYDLIISVTGAEAKAVKSGRKLYAEGKKNVKNRKGVHISYCHVPTQYYWQMYDDYVENPGFGILNPVVRFFFKALVKPLRKKDFEAAQGVDYFVTISDYAKGLISKYYKRDAVVIHPSVEVEEFRNLARGDERGEKSRDLARGKDREAKSYYITTSRQVNWKRIDLAVKACAKTGRELLVVGEGPEHDNLMKLAKGKDNIEFLPLQKKEELAHLLAEAKGYLFPSMEPFGIAPVEALAVGCPVIAYGVGGALDYVEDGKNGVLFEKQNVTSLISALDEFEKKKFDSKKVSETAEKFSARRFDREIQEFVDEKMA